MAYRDEQTREEVLRRIVSDWIDEGFTTPPYPEPYYDVFEWLGITNDNTDSGDSYDVERPK